MHKLPQEIAKFYFKEWFSLDITQREEGIALITGLS